MKFGHAILCCIIIAVTIIIGTSLTKKTDTIIKAKDVPKVEIEWKHEDDFLPHSLYNSVSGGSIND